MGEVEDLSLMREALEKIANPETSRCNRCEGEGRLWADGKAHYGTYAGPTIPCPDCEGRGSWVSEDPEAVARAALDMLEPSSANDPELAAATAKSKADASFRKAGLDPAAIDAARAADDKEYDARVRELEAKCPDSVLGPPQVYRIAYRTVAGAKPTFIHVRAESPTRALMAFIDGTSPLQVSAVKLDNEYGGPLLNERENFWPASNEAKTSIGVAKDREDQGARREP